MPPQKATLQHRFNELMLKVARHCDTARRIDRCGPELDEMLEENEHLAAELAAIRRERTLPNRGLVPVSTPRTLHSAPPHHKSF